MDKDRERLFTEIEETLEQLAGSHVPESVIVEQAEIFQKGLPFVKLLRPCTLSDGITKLGPEEHSRLKNLHEKAAAEGRLMKFVPASGAATRMFKDLLAVVKTDAAVSFADLEKKAATDGSVAGAVKFLQRLEEFPFYDDLQSFAAGRGKDLKQLMQAGEWRQVLAMLLDADGLNYASLPKGLIPFHKYPDCSRTPIWEHLREAAEYVLSQGNVARIHFTLSPEHLSAAKKHFDHIRPAFAGIRLEIDTSVQKPTTDTIAVTRENEAFRDSTGKLSFRPGGHGALLENLNDLGGDIVFVKNIDNVSPDRLRDDTILYKKLLCGLLVETQSRIFSFLAELETGKIDDERLDTIETFARTRLSLVLSGGFPNFKAEQKAATLFSLLNRPLRVCGMVRNQGEPGGGPFWIIENNEKVSIQIVESAQVDTNDADQKSILSSSTHFNPVDLVCGVRDYKGKCFNLHEFSNKNMGFITMKSKDGTDVKALELPGLWNGGMAEWNTIFVEVPSTTFSPVKTVNDLLRSEHRA